MVPGPGEGGGGAPLRRAHPPEEVERDGEVELNPQTKVFQPKRRAAEVAKETVRETFRYEDKELEDD